MAASDFLIKGIASFFRNLHVEKALFKDKFSNFQMLMSFGEGHCQV